MKCQSLFSEKNLKNIVNLSSAEFAQREAKVNQQIFISNVFTLSIETDNAEQTM